MARPAESQLFHGSFETHGALPRQTCLMITIISPAVHRVGGRRYETYHDDLDAILGRHLARWTSHHAEGDWERCFYGRFFVRVPVGLLVAYQGLESCCSRFHESGPGCVVCLDSYESLCSQNYCLRSRARFAEGYQGLLRALTLLLPSQVNDHGA